VGTSATSAEFVGKIRRASRNLGQLPLECARQNQRTAEGALGAAVTQMSGDGVLSRVGRRGAPVGVTARVVGPGRVAVIPKGPVWLVENGTASHLIGAGRGRDRAVRGRAKVKGLGRFYDLGGEGRPMWIGPGEFRMGPFIHPGTSGKGRWRQTRDGPLWGVVKKSATVGALRAVGSVFG
jgi:hypothetical protein